MQALVWLRMVQFGAVLFVMYKLKTTLHM